jgi:hypothetical protein
MNAATQFAVMVLVAVTICSPSIAFILWLTLQSQKKKKLGVPFTHRVRSSVVSVLTALAACVVVAGISRTLETSSSSGLLVTASMISAYAFYAFVAVDLVALVLLLMLWGISSFLKAPNQPPEPTR